MDMGPELSSGEVLDGRFEIVTPLGMGGMGSVYRARDRDHGGEVAIKVLHETVGSQVEPRLRFEREARALGALDHPRIVPIRGFGVAGGKPYLVMEMLEGRMVTQVIVEDAPLEPARAVAIARQILEGVAYAHAQGIIHRDLKSPNVFLERDDHGREQVRILDFGFAKFFDKEKWTAEQTLTSEGDVFGTPAYMAPEQALGQRVDARADVYAIGILLFELLTGLRPFRSKDRQQLYRQHLSDKPPRMHEVRSDLRMKRTFERVVQKALEKERDKRWRDAGEMLAALDGAPVPTAGDAPSGAGTGGGGRSPLVIVAVAGGVFVALSCVASAAALWLM